MDRRILRTSPCNGSGKNPSPSSPAAVSRPASSGGIGSKDDAAAGERKALLPRQPPGGMARKGRKGSNRRVQWKDKHGSKLTDVREFQPRYVENKHPHSFYVCFHNVLVQLLMIDATDSKNLLIPNYTIELYEFCNFC